VCHDGPSLGVAPTSLGWTLAEPVRQMCEGIGESAIENPIAGTPLRASSARPPYCRAAKKARWTRAVPFGPLPVSAELQDSE